MFHVGQMVVCVNDDFSRIILRGEELPVKGRVYTVRAISMHVGGLGILLHEIVNKPRHYYTSIGECWFRASRFRPAQTRPTSIEIFDRIRDQVTKKETV
jgi:hypothetical protein